MKIIELALLSFIIFFFIKINAQTMAIMETGDTIYVYSNGAWSYDNNEDFEDSKERGFFDINLKLDSISQPFFLSPSANKIAQSKFGFYKIMYDKKKWKRLPVSENSDNDQEMAFRSKKKSIECFVIGEEVEVSPEALLKFAINNLRTNMNEIEILKTECRLVNGNEILRGVVKGEKYGINYILDGFYFSNQNGTIQFGTVSPANLHSRYEQDILEFLNGLVILK